MGSGTVSSIGPVLGNLLGRPPSLHTLRRRSPALVRALRRYYAVARLPAGVHGGLMGSSPSPPGPLTTCGRLRGLPVLAHGVSLHAWGLRLRGAAPRSRYRVCALLPSGPPDAVGSPKRGISELNTQPTDTPVQRFKCDLTIALTWLGARVARYAFPVRLFHSLLHAGLSRRYPGETACPTNALVCFPWWGRRLRLPSDSSSFCLIPPRPPWPKLCVFLSVSASRR